MAFYIKGIAAGVGLASESIKARKTKREQSSASNQISSSSSENDPKNIAREVSSPLVEDNDEVIWQLDSAQDDISPPNHDQTTVVSGKLPAESSADEGMPKDVTPQEKEKDTFNIEKIVARFMARNPSPQYAPTFQISNRLTLPVILPQRRPRSRARGFTRAYAPLLENCDISQSMFLDFLATFNGASLANPWINAINFAGLAVHGVAPGVAVAINIAIAITVQAAKEVNSRQRTNTFLDAMNNEFFRPRGLYCLVLTWNPESDNPTNTIDLASTIWKSTDSNTGKSHTRNKYHTSSGNTYGDFELPAAAPLVFPVLDEVEFEGEEGTKQKMKRKGNFVSDYMDRRARAKWAAEHPQSVLSTGPKDKFTSRYADPNHPASSGNPWSFISGGHFNPPTGIDILKAGSNALRGQRSDMMGERKVFMGRRSLQEHAQRVQSTKDEGQVRNGYGGRGLGGLGGGFGGINPLVKGAKKILGFNVLYLMVVNMPNDEEMAAANAYARDL